jgi:hypothetical protein
MKGAKERNRMAASGVLTGKLVSRFDGLGARVREKCKIRPLHWRNLAELARKVGQRTIVEIRSAHVQQRIGLTLDRSNDSRVTVAGRANRDAGREVQKVIPVDIDDDGAAAALDDERIHTRVRRRRVTLIRADQLPGLRPRKRSDNRGSM